MKKIGVERKPQEGGWWAVGRVTEEFAKLDWSGRRQ